MLYQFITDADTKNTVILIGALLAFVLTFIALRLFLDKLPTDGGREFAVDGSKSIGKPRGAGIVFIIVYTVISLFFGNLSLESFLYCLPRFRKMSPRLFLIMMRTNLIKVLKKRTFRKR